MAVLAAKYVSQNVKGKSINRCAEYWRKGHQKAGFKFATQPSAYMYVKVMPSIGYVKIPEPKPPQIGDTRIFQPHRQTPGGGGVHGHIEVWDGSGWCSDYKSAKPLPNGHYKKVQHLTTYWRHKDLLNGAEVSSTPQTPVGEGSDGGGDGVLSSDIDFSKANSKANEAYKSLFLLPNKALEFVQDLPELLMRRATAIDAANRGEDTGWVFDVNADTEIEAVLNTILMGSAYIPEMESISSPDTEYGKLSSKDLIDRVFRYDRYINPFYYEMFGKEFHRDVNVKPLYFWPQQSNLDTKFINQFDAAEMYKLLYQNKYKSGLMGKEVEAHNITDTLEESSRDSEGNDDHDNPEAMFLMLETRYLKTEDHKIQDDFKLEELFVQLLERLGLSKTQATLMAKALAIANPVVGAISMIGGKVYNAVKNTTEWATGDFQTTYTGEFPEYIKSKFGSLQVSTRTNIGQGYPANIRAAMDFISRCEGTHEAQGYKGYGEFSAYSEKGRALMQRSMRGEIGHPTNYNGTRGWSSAAGRYQAMGKTGPDTWREANLGLGKKGLDGKGDVPMTPKNQDEFFIARLKFRGVYEAALKGDWKTFLTKGGRTGLAAEFASVPLNATGLQGVYSGQGAKLDRTKCLEALVILQKFYEGAKAGQQVTVDGKNVVERVLDSMVPRSPLPEAEIKKQRERTYTTSNGNMGIRINPKAGTMQYKKGIGKVSKDQFKQLQRIKNFTDGSGVNTVKGVDVLDAGLLKVTVRAPGEVTFIATIMGANLPKKASYTGGKDEFKAEEAKDYAEDFLEGTSWFSTDKDNFKLTIMGYDETLQTVKVSIQKKQKDGKFLYYSSHMLEKGFAIPDKTTNANGKALSERAKKAKAGMWTDPDKIYQEVAEQISSTQAKQVRETIVSNSNFSTRLAMGEIFEDKKARKPTRKYPTPVNFTDNTKTGQWSTTTTFANDSEPGLKGQNGGIKVIAPLPGILKIHKSNTPGGVIATLTTDSRDLVLKYYNLHEKSLEIVSDGKEKRVKAGDAVGIVKGLGRVPELPFEAIFRQVPFNPLCAKDLSTWPINTAYNLGEYLNKDGFKSTTNPKVLVSNYEWVRAHSDGSIVGVDGIVPEVPPQESIPEAQKKTYQEMRGHNYEKVKDPDGEGPLRDSASVFSNTLVYTNVLRNFLKPFEYGNSHMLPQVKGYVVVGNEDDDYYAEGVPLREPVIYELPAIQSFSLVCNNDYNPVDVVRFTVVNPSHMLSTPLYYDPNKKGDIKQAHTQFYSPAFLEKARIKAGTRVSFKIGYTNNPNFNPTVFNGVIKQTGGQKDYFLECIAEGFGAELLNSEYGSQKPLDFTNGHNASTGAIFGLSLLDEAISHFGARMGKWRTAVDYVGSIFRDQHVDEFASGAEWQNDTIFEGKGRIGDMRDPEAKAMVAPWSWGDNIFNLWFPTRANLANRVYMNIFSDVIESVHDQFLTHPSLWLNLLSWDKSANWRYYAYKSTPWSIMKEMEYRHPGTLTKPLIYDERMTLFFGIPFQNYISTDLRPHFMMSSALSNRFEDLNNPYSSTYLKARTSRMQPSTNYHLLHSDFNIISNRLSLNREFKTRVNVLEFNRTFDGHDPNSSSDVITVTLDDNLAAHELRSKTIALGGTHKEHSAYLYGTQELKKELEQMYTGEIVLVGNPHIKAGDYAYIQDRVRGLSGTIKIRECEHHITENDGYITVVTPGLWVEPSQFAWSNHLVVLTSLGKFTSEVLSDVSVETLLEDMATYQAIAIAASTKHESLSNMLVAGGSTAGFAFLGGRIAMRLARKIISPKMTSGALVQAGRAIGTGILQTAKAYGAKSLSAISQSSKFRAAQTFITTKAGQWRYFKSLGTAAKWLKGGKIPSLAIRLGTRALMLARGIVSFVGGIISGIPVLGWLAAALVTVAISFVKAKIDKERLTRQPLSFIPLTYNYSPYVAGVDGFINNTYLEALWENAKQVWRTVSRAVEYYDLNHGGVKPNKNISVAGSNTI